MLMRFFVGSAANCAHSTCIEGVNGVSTECVGDSGYDHPKDDSGAEIAILCVDIDECYETKVHGIRQSCKANSQCVNGLDSTYACNCDGGYESDDAKVNDCTDIDECNAKVESGNQHNCTLKQLVQTHLQPHLYMQFFILGRRW